MKESLGRNNSSSRALVSLQFSFKYHYIRKVGDYYYDRRVRIIDSTCVPELRVVSAG